MASNDPIKIGAVVVAGGGIAGVQAALDLADSGLYVYLVENATAIGGKMAQLDKTFPTNDCSMCTLSPKLVEVGRHINIELITGAEVSKVEGSKGNFRVGIHKTPRYIDESKCIGCGACARACPVSLSSGFDQGLSTQKAAYKEYAQAIPAAYAIVKRGTSPCKAECPAHISAQGFVAFAAQGKYDKALNVIKDQNPLPAVCGRVCHHPCESACTRGELDEPLAIKEIERFLADRDLHAEKRYTPKCKKRRDEKVAVIGSGPAGLSCAYFLARQGYPVCIYEQRPEPGGMLYAGIPGFRLPREVVRAEIRVIQDMGVEIRTGMKLGEDVTVEQLRNEGCRAVFLAVGAQAARAPGIEGEMLEGVCPALEWLEKINTAANPPSLAGQRVAVLGGDDVAVDAARSALRLGAEAVSILYPGSRAQMPAGKEKIRECEAEGILVQDLSAPLRIIGENGRASAVECVKTRFEDSDEAGFQKTVPVAGSEVSVPIDRVFHAAGREPDGACLAHLKEQTGCKISGQAHLHVDAVTMQTDDPAVFAGGDAVGGVGTVVEAVEAGKQAAVSIDRYLNGQDLSQDRPEAYKDRIAQNIPTEGFDRLPRQLIPGSDPEDTAYGFQKAEPGFTEEQVRSEAARCINCGVCAECYQCVSACPAKAVTLQTHAQQPEDIELPVGAVVMAPGIELFDPSGFDVYGYRRFADVITSMEFERILSASGPYGGHMVRPSDQKEPEKIAWIQCVGSRDESHGNPYCSSVCCTYAIKEAMIAKEHSAVDLDAAIFYIDIRTQGKDFEKYYMRARDEAGVRFIKSKISGVADNGSGRLTLRYFNGSGKILTEDFDLVVLSIGLQPKAKASDMADKCGISLDDDGFAATSSFTPVESSRPGVYVCGAFKGPKDIPESVMEAYAAVGACCSSLKEVRYSRVKEKTFPAETAVEGELPRIGVFVCHCGNNIGGVVDVPQVRDYARTLPYVVHANDNLFTCSQDTQEKIKKAIKKHKLNRVVVASCSPRTHEPLFRETLREAGLNKYLFEMANIRDQCSWVHPSEPEKATAKARDLVRMAVAKASRLQPLEEIKIGVSQQALVIGGGIAGMTAALDLAEQGFSVHLVEKEKELGGNARHLDRTWRGEDITEFVRATAEQVKNHPLIRLHLESVVSGAEGVVGNFSSTLQSADKTETVTHGAVIITTGARQLEPAQYACGEHPMVFLSLDFEQALRDGPEKFNGVKTAVFIQCVGSREPERPYCSKICCTQSIQNAIRLKTLNPEMKVYILYRQIRSYGKREALYRQARSLGIVFIRYSPEEGPAVEPMEKGLRITVRDRELRMPLQIDSDMLVLASAIIPNDSETVARQYKTSISQDGFFQEAHVKLRPVDSSTDGVFMAGLCHCPKPLEESISQAKAASSRAAGVLAKAELAIEPIVSVVDAEKCSGCGTCERVCPWDAIHLVETDGRWIAQTNTASCKGCGVCAASCPSKAVDMYHFRQDQIREQILAFTDDAIAPAGLAAAT